MFSECIEYVSMVLCVEKKNTRKFQYSYYYSMRCIRYVYIRLCPTIVNRLQNNLLIALSRDDLSQHCDLQ